MRLLVINPNTSEAMTEDIRKTVERVKSADVDVDVVHPDFGAEGLESFYDYEMAAFGMLRLIRNLKQEYDGVLVACFGDPGLYSIKEICKCPVIGIAEASIAMSILLGTKFAILAASEKAIPMMDTMVTCYGMQDRCAGVFSINMGVLDAEEDKEATIRALIKAGTAAKERGADVLIPGCAGMTGISDAVEQALNVRVLDPVGMGYAVLEMLAGQKQGVSRMGIYAPPAPKKILHEEFLHEEFLD